MNCCLWMKCNVGSSNNSRFALSAQYSLMCLFQRNKGATACLVQTNGGPLRIQKVRYSIRKHWSRTPVWENYKTCKVKIKRLELFLGHIWYSQVFTLVFLNHLILSNFHNNIPFQFLRNKSLCTHPLSCRTTPVDLSLKKYYKLNTFSVIP